MREHYLQVHRKTPLPNPSAWPLVILDMDWPGRTAWTTKNTKSVKMIIGACSKHVSQDLRQFKAQNKGLSGGEMQNRLDGNSQPNKIQDARLWLCCASQVDIESQSQETMSQDGMHA